MKFNYVFSNFLVVEPFEPEEKTSGGLYTAPANNYIRNKGVVTHSGPGVFENGELKRNPINVGDTILFHQGAPYEINEDGKRVFILRATDVIATIEK